MIYSASSTSNFKDTMQALIPEATLLLGKWWDSAGAELLQNTSLNFLARFACRTIGAHYTTISAEPGRGRVDLTQCLS